MDDLEADTQHFSILEEYLNNPPVVPPLPELRLPIKVEAKYSADEMQKIRGGYYASCMEEKWNITYEEGKLLFRRSWTDFCIFIVEFVEKDGDFYILSAEVNNNPDEYGPMGGGFEEACILFLIDNLLLKKDVELCSELPDSAEGITLWSYFGNAIGHAID